MEDEVGPIIGELCGAVKSSIPVVVDLLAEAAVEDVVGVSRAFGQRLLHVVFADGRQAVAVVPGVFGGVSGDEVGFLDAVPSAVVFVIESAVGEQAVVGAGGVAGERAVAVQVVGVALVGLEGMRGGAGSV